MSTFWRGFLLGLGFQAARSVWRWGWRLAAAGTLWALLAS